MLQYEEYQLSPSVILGGSGLVRDDYVWQLGFGVTPNRGHHEEEECHDRS